MKRLVLLGLLMLPLPGMAQDADDMPFHDVKSALDSRSAAPLPSNPQLGADGRAVLFTQRIQIDAAAWLQLSFAEAQLGSSGLVRIASVADGDAQQLSGPQLADWANTSAAFNGDAVDVTLYGAPAEPGLFIRLGQIRVGDPAGLAPATICDGGDDREFSNDPRVGRAAPTGCTVWIIENGAVLTAGHCVADGNLTTAEFNVPPSRPDGTKVRAAVRDQYPVTVSSMQSRNNGIGNDWAAFAVGANSTTGKTPLQAQGAAFRVSTSSNPGNVRITGFGTAQQTRNQAQQTTTGLYLGQTMSGAARVSHTYRVDTTGGNSGSPIIASDGVSAIGIHTNGGCSATGGRNSGTSFNNADLMSAVQAVGQVAN